MTTRRLVGGVRAGGVGWAVAGLVLVQAVTEFLLVPSLASSGVPGVAQIAVVLVLGTLARVVLGGAVAWRLLRAGEDDSGQIVRTVILGVLIGLGVTWIAAWVVVRPLWGVGLWAAELGRILIAVVLWVVPCGWGAHRLVRSDIASQMR
jgi:peptidoglycan biosynthesis protein MviN/MurJ (putative lipid II flippase)